MRLLFSSSGAIQPRGPPTSANGVGSFLAALNEIHSDVTFERITGAWWEQERGELAPSPLARALHGPPSVADGAADPELGHGETAHRRTSLIPVLSCCQSGRSRVRCYSVPSPLCWTPPPPVCALPRPRYITQMEFLVVSKSGVGEPFEDPARHRRNGHSCSAGGV